MKSKFLLGIFAAIMLAGCGRVVPPGTTVIVRKPGGESKIITKGVYKAWGRDRLYFLDNKYQSFEERDMQILCTDEINMTVDVKTLMSFRVDDSSLEFIQAKIPAVPVNEGEVSGHQLSLNKFYNMAVQPIIRAVARDIVSTYKTDDIRANRKKIAGDIDTEVRARLEALEYPLDIRDVMISNIDYPQIVKDQREAIKTAQLEDQRRAALAEAEIAEAQRAVAIETERAKVRMIRAQAQADENAILTQSLTPEFLLWRQYEVMEMSAQSLSKGNNNTVFMMPYSAINPDSLNAALIGQQVKNN